MPTPTPTATPEPTPTNVRTRNKKNEKMSIRAKLNKHQLFLKIPKRFLNMNEDKRSFKLLF
jgi:hypothetical protein